MPSLADIGEFPLIERIRTRLPAPTDRVRVPVGDDAAASRGPEPGWLLVSTVDLLTEGMDFTADTPARTVGWKAVAVNLSDLAAMGARPTGVLIALAMPATTDVRWVEEFYDGVAAICRAYGTDVLGGDLSGVAPGGGITVSVTALGEAREGAVLRRTGARAGDLVCVTGTLGDAAAGLLRLRAGGAVAPGDPLVLRQREPTPRVEAARALAAAGVVRAMVDVSDGLLADLGHLAREAGLGARIETARLPASDALRASGFDLRECVLSGGEDFELLFAVDPADEARARDACASAGVAMTAVGRFTPEPGLRLVEADGREMAAPAGRGWTHF